MRDTELMAKWFDDVAAAVRRRIAGLDDAALEWRADDRGNNVRETVWHMARWIDVLERFAAGSDSTAERWIADGWAARTGYDPRGLGDDGLGVLSGYTFEEVLRIPRLTAEDLLTYLDSVVTPFARRLREADEESAPKLVRRATGILQGCFGHIGEIDALLAIRERTAQPASA